MSSLPVVFSHVVFLLSNVSFRGSYFSSGRIYNLKLRITLKKLEAVPISEVNEYRR
jgi:hypothetical protein